MINEKVFYVLFVTLCSKVLEDFFGNKNVTHKQIDRYAERLRHTESHREPTQINNKTENRRYRTGTKFQHNRNIRYRTGMEFSLMIAKLGRTGVSKITRKGTRRNGREIW